MKDLAPCPELKGCPFCGGEAAINRYNEVVCIKVGCHGIQIGDEEKSAVDKWNTRTPTPDLGVAVEALKSVQNSLTLLAYNSSQSEERMFFASLAAKVKEALKSLGGE